MVRFLWRAGGIPDCYSCCTSNLATSVISAFLGRISEATVSEYTYNYIGHSSPHGLLGHSLLNYFTFIVGN